MMNLMVDGVKKEVYSFRLNCRREEKKVRR
jgi:hypothetical protein